MTLTVTATPHLSLPSPAVLVQVSTTLQWRPVDVFRVHEDGSEYRVITAAGNRSLVGGLWIEADRHVPWNQDVHYRAQTSNDSGTSGPVRVISKRSWIIDGSDPNQAVLLSGVRLMADRNWADRVERLDIQGSESPIHLTGPLSLETGTLTAQVHSPREFRALQKLTGRPVLLNLSLSEYDVGWLWVVIRAPKLANQGMASFGLREFVLTFEGTRQPDVDGQAYWTVSDLAATGWTITEAAAQYSSVTNMALDVRSG